MNKVFTAIGKAWSEGIVWFVDSAPWYVQLFIAGLVIVAILKLILKIFGK